MVSRALTASGPSERLRTMANRVFRQELYGLVWSTPMKTLAKRLGISDVGLKKTCSRAWIPTPNRGHWAKIAAGKKTTQIPLPLRPPGMDDEIWVARGSNYWYPAISDEELRGPLPSPPEFPEPIEAVRERIAEAVQQITVSPKRTFWHPVIDQLLKEDENRRAQQRVAAYPMPWNARLFDSPLERRRLRILNSLFFAVAKMNGRATIVRNEPRGTEPSSVLVNFFEQHVRFTLEPLARPRHRGQVAVNQPRSPEESKLFLSIAHSDGIEGSDLTWRDTDDGKIEAHATEIVVEIILSAERQYRAGRLRQYEWRVKRKADLEEDDRKRTIEAERVERARQARIMQARVNRLLKDAAAFQQASEIREYVATMRTLQHAEALTTAEDFDRWAEWALAQADRIDPTKNKTFLASMRDSGDGEDGAEKT